MTIFLAPTTFKSGGWVHASNENLAILRTEGTRVSAINPAAVHHVRHFAPSLITAAFTNSHPAGIAENQPRESVSPLVAPSLTLDTFDRSERAQMSGL